MNRPLFDDGDCLDIGGAQRRISFRWRADSTGVAAHLSSQSDPGRSFSFSLYVVPPMGLSIEVRRKSRTVPAKDLAYRWSMAAGVMAGGGAEHEVFAETARWARDELYCSDTLDGAPEGFPTIRTLLRRLAVHVADLCVPDLRGKALRFSEPIRFRIYERFVVDQTRRLAQLAETCPGALIFAVALIEKGGQQAAAGEALISDVVAGRPLKKVLVDAVARWAEADGSPAAARLAAGGPAERDRLLAAQRYLVMHASARVAPTFVWLPPPVTFVPDDVPRSPRANARWFRVMKTCGALFREDAPANRALAAFASTRAEWIFSNEKDRSPREKLQQLMDYIRATGRRPDRRTDPAALMAECDAWHQRIAASDLSHFERLAGLHPGALSGPAIVLPAAPRADWSSDGVRVQAIRTAQRLVEEGRLMNHCVGTYLPQALAGSSYIYTAIVHGVPLTIELRATSVGVQLVQVQGVGNRSPSASELTALRPWLDHLGARAPAVPRPLAAGP